MMPIRLEHVQTLLWGVRRVCVLFLWWWPARSIACKVASCTDATSDVQRVYTCSGVSCSDANMSRVCPDIVLGCVPRRGCFMCCLSGGDQLHP